MSQRNCVAFLHERSRFLALRRSYEIDGSDFIGLTPASPVRELSHPFVDIGLLEIGPLKCPTRNQTKADQCTFHWTMAPTTIWSVLPVASPTTFGSPAFQFARDPS